MLLPTALTATMVTEYVAPALAPVIVQVYAVAESSASVLATEQSLSGKPADVAMAS